MSRRPFAGQRALVASAHGKAHALAPALEPLGFVLATAEGFDTDPFGSFTGEIPRAGGMRDAAGAKIQAALAGLGSSPPPDWAFASEGAFGPHPVLPFLAGYTELVLARRVADGLEIVETRSGFDTNFASLDLPPGGDPAGFLDRIGFPDHAVIVRALAAPSEDGASGAGAGPVLARGVADRVALDRLLAAASGPVRIETDMRAMNNPTRMAEIARASLGLARRLAKNCPACASPGWGVEWVEPGLPCGSCGTPTGLARAKIWSCPACRYAATCPRSDARVVADPGDCPACNP